MLRIALSAQDLGRIRVVPSYGPLAETMLALGQFRRTSGPAHRRWRAAAAARLTPLDQAVVGYLRPLECIGVDYATLAGPTDSIGAGQEALLDSPDADFAVETRHIGRDKAALPAWVDSDREYRPRLVDYVGRLYGQLVQPVWPRVRDTTAAEASRLAAGLATMGITEFLRSQPRLGWDGTHLEIHDAGLWSCDDTEGELGGRGIDIVPSYFASTAEPYFPIDRTRPAVLFVPVREILPAPPRGTRDLDRALGRTRAAVLVALTEGTHSTTSLAEHLDLPLSSASQHVSVLRGAGLASTTRRGGRALHSATTLGRRLVAGGNGRARSGPEG